MSEPYLIHLTATLSRAHLSEFLSLTFPDFDPEHIALKAFLMDDELLALNDWTRVQELFYFEDTGRFFREKTVKDCFDEFSRHGPFLFTYDEAAQLLEFQIEGDENLQICNMMLLGFLQISGLCERGTLSVVSVFGDTDMPYAADFERGQVTHLTPETEPERLEIIKADFFTRYDALFQKFEATEGDQLKTEALTASLNQLGEF